MQRDALIIVDMQVASFEGAPRHDAEGLVARLNALAAHVRDHDGLVIFIQHEGEQPGFARGAPGWALLPALTRDARDVTLAKTMCDSFQGTDLEALLKRHHVSRVIVTGCATDFCVDTTVRAAAVKGFDTWAPADGHTTADRPHLPAPQVIAHHNYVWSDFIGARGPVNVRPVADLLAGA